MPALSISMSTPVVLDLPFASCAFSAVKTASPSKKPPSIVSSCKDRNPPKSLQESFTRIHVPQLHFRLLETSQYNRQLNVQPVRFLFWSKVDQEHLVKPLECQRYLSNKQF